MQAIDVLKERLQTKGEAIERWFAEQYGDTRPFFYSSVDMRHSGFKLAPVDTNLFPAGFNLLPPHTHAEVASAFAAHIARWFPKVKRVILVPENHTRNGFYLDNVAVLKSLLVAAGLEVLLGGLQVEEGEVMEVESATQGTLPLHALTRQDDRLSVAMRPEFEADLILINNDFSSGAPEILSNLKQEVAPPVGMGWYRRRKTGHFSSYSDLAHSFARAFSLDPWMISAHYTKCGTINFKQQKGVECIARGVERCLRVVERKYEAYGIKEAPYVFIKADAGTYGMGIMTVSSPEEVFELNKKQRNKMHAIKEGVESGEVIIQEGIPTVDLVEGKPAEPMLYLVGGKPVGCTYRVNAERDARGNLNARGMTFNTACAGDAEAAGEVESLCPVQGLIARLASLAAVRECYEPSWSI